MVIEICVRKSCWGCQYLALAPDGGTHCVNKMSVNYHCKIDYLSRCKWYMDYAGYMSSVQDRDYEHDDAVFAAAMAMAVERIEKKVLKD